MHLLTGEMPSSGILPSCLSQPCLDLPPASPNHNPINILSKRAAIWWTDRDCQLQTSCIKTPTHLNKEVRNKSHYWKVIVWSQAFLPDSKKDLEQLMRVNTVQWDRPRDRKASVSASASPPSPSSSLSSSFLQGFDGHIVSHNSSALPLQHKLADPQYRTLNYHRHIRLN